MAIEFVRSFETTYPGNEFAVYLPIEEESEFRRVGASSISTLPRSLPADVCRMPDASPDDKASTHVLPISAGDELLGLLMVGSREGALTVERVDLGLLILATSHLAVTWQNIKFAEQIARNKREIEELMRQIEAVRMAPPEKVVRCEGFPEMVGASESLHRVLQIARLVAPSPLPVLIGGETGTGKELLARALHRLSSRADKSFVCINCPTIPTDLAESELFGHTRGAFTGANDAKAGLFEAADGGTVFLDEIGDLPPAVQVKLLRVLQEGEVQRLGSQAPRKLDLRVLAATNRNLLEEVRDGRFREDLYHRLSGVLLELPPLRERLSDLAPLATYYLEAAAARLERTVQGFTTEALAALESYEWPGNIRELQRVIDRAVLVCPADLVRVDDLGDAFKRSTQPRTDSSTAATDEKRSLSHQLRDEKLRMVQDALARNRGNQAAAARELGMSRSNLNRLLKRYGIRSDDFDPDLNKSAPEK